MSSVQHRSPGPVGASAREDLRILERVLRRHLAGTGVRVWLFGSLARGDFDRASDIDIALDAGRPLDPDRLARLREAIEEAPIVRPVDLLDLATASADLRARILQGEGRVWLAFTSD